MSSKRGSGKASLAGGASSHSTPPAGPASGDMSPHFDQLNCDVTFPVAEPEHDGDWEIFAKKSKYKNMNIAPKLRGASTASPKAGGHQEMLQKSSVGNNSWKAKAAGSSMHYQAQDPRKPAGRGNANARVPQSAGSRWESAYAAPPPAIAPPLQNGWQWAARGTNPSQMKSSNDKHDTGPKCSSEGPSTVYKSPDENQQDDGSDDDQLVEDSDDDFLSDDYDSDASQKSYETRKKNRWFMTFFEAIDNLTNEELSDSTRQWHCPACHDGPGAIDWYKGLHPLMTHAKTKGSKRVKLHRELAELLEEELHRRGTSVVPAGDAFGKWKGLRSSTTDHEIVWPPMVVIRNTVLEQDENDKWIGMGNQELLDYFGSYQATKARHSYGPQGHRGISVLIFEASAVGYHEAERLHKHFVEQGKDKDAWENRRVLLAGGKRQLYGYIAHKEDLDYFNQHCQGKSKMKFEMRSYQEMVVGGMKQMSEDNQQLLWLKNKDAKHKQHSKALEETVGLMSSQLRIANEENNILRLRTKKQYEENKEEMDFMEQFFKEKMAAMLDAREAKEQAFEDSLQQERAKAELSSVRPGSTEERKYRQEETAKFIDSQEKWVKEFESEREKLEKSHKDKITELKRKYHEEEVELEKQFDATMTELIEKYSQLAPRPTKP